MAKYTKEDFIEIQVPADRVMDVYAALSGRLTVDAATLDELEKQKSIVRSLEDQIQQEAKDHLQVTSRDAAEIADLKERLQKQSQTIRSLEADLRDTEQQKPEEPKEEAPPPAPETPTEGEQEEYKRGTLKYDPVEIEAKAKELGIFTVKRLAEAFGMPGPSMNNFIKKMFESDTINRHGGKRGPGVFYTHKAYGGPIDFTIARGGIKYSPGGKQQIEEEIGVDGAPKLGDVRDLVVGWTSTFDPATVQLAMRDKGNYSIEGITLKLRELAKKGILIDESPSPDMNLFRYEAPAGEGAGAKLDRARRPKEDPATVPRDGTGPSGHGQKVKNKEVAELIKDCVAQGCTYKQAGNSHWEIKLPNGKRVLIANTPRSSRGVQNDRARVRRAGVSV